jgi:hypothetical protein
MDLLTFVPYKFPTPLDIGLTWALFAKDRSRPLEAESAGVLEDIIERVQSQATWRAWDSIQNEAKLAIPSPHRLSHQDVVEIRKWYTWGEMIDSLEDYLLQPVSVAKTEQFQTQFDTFLTQLSNWWLAKSRRDRERWASGVAKVYRVGKWFVGLVAIASQVIPVLPPNNVNLVLPSEDAVKVTMETGLYLFERGKIDWRRTQTLRHVKAVQTMSREELDRTWNTIRNLYSELPVRFPGHDLTVSLATEEE